MFKYHVFYHMNGKEWERTLTGMRHDIVGTRPYDMHLTIYEGDPEYIKAVFMGISGFICNPVTASPTVSNVKDLDVLSANS
jgi:hypothetical protein